MLYPTLLLLLFNPITTGVSHMRHLIQRPTSVTQYWGLCSEAAVDCSGLQPAGGQSQGQPRLPIL